ncbi:MAG: hypothetical protein HYY88_07645 [candidate division NC10 bacterium]|nr:hypothetical protein [candidate division NC10 bacterium]
MPRGKAEEWCDRSTRGETAERSNSPGRAGVGGVSFQVAKGDLVAIIGANGAGNSPSLRALMGLEVFALFPLLAQRRAQPGRPLPGRRPSRSPLPPATRSLLRA